MPVNLNLEDQINDPPVTQWIDPADVEKAKGHGGVWMLGAALLHDPKATGVKYSRYYGPISYSSALEGWTVPAGIGKKVAYVLGVIEPMKPHVVLPSVVYHAAYGYVTGSLIVETMVALHQDFVARYKQKFLVEYKA